MNNSIQISILGCGWLGFPLAVELVKTGYSVKGSTTSPEKLLKLASYNIDPFLVHLGEGIKDRNAKHFFECDILIISIPPKKDPGNYLLQIEELTRSISSVKKVIYISSTSVYGNPNRELNELDAASPDTSSGKAILKAENLLLSDPAFKTSVIRFGGLTGPERDPARFLSGKINLANGQAPVNLIHLDDCIGIIKAILKKDAFGKIFHACSPDHPKRQDFYTLAAKMSGLPEPQFLDELKAWKIVNSINVPGFLSYDYQVKDWLGWLRLGKPGL